MAEMKLERERDEDLGSQVKEFALRPIEGF